MQATAAMQTVTPIARSPISASRPMLRDVGRGAPCSMCRLKEHCIPRGLDADEMPFLDQLVARRVRLRKGEVLFRTGEKFTSLFAIHSGSCKTVLQGYDGNDQVAGYHMMGDIIGTDGINAERYECDAVAL